MKLCGGIDLHSNNSVIVLTDREDRVLYSKRLDNNLGVILRVLEPYRERIEALVVESARSAGIG